MLLRTVGGWPEELFGLKPLLIGRIQRSSFSIQTFIILIGSLYYLISNFSNMDFLVSGHIFITASLSVLMMVSKTRFNFVSQDANWSQKPMWLVEFGYITK